MIREQAIFNLEIKKKSGLSINPDIHHSKVFSSDRIETAKHNNKAYFAGEYFLYFEKLNTQVLIRAMARHIKLFGKILNI